MKDIKFSIPNISKQDINLVGKIIKSGIDSINWWPVIVPTACAPPPTKTKITQKDFANLFSGLIK